MFDTIKQYEIESLRCSIFQVGECTVPEREMFGRYILLERLAASSDGMSEIYKAQTRDSAGYSQFVLLKRFVPRSRGEEQWLTRVTEEAYSFIGVEQPSLVQITDMGRIGNYFFQATEYVDGPDLRTIINRCLELNVPIPLECIALIGASLCDALDSVHRTSDERGIPLNVAHLGISPRQVRIGWNGAVKLNDLTTARLGLSSILSDQGMVQGNLPYMAPEQARVDYISDIRSDIFLIGATLYECISLYPLYRGADQYSLLNQVRKAEYEPLSMLRSDVPRNLERVITKALSREPGLRYANCIALREDLLRVIVTLGNGDADYSTLAGFMASIFGNSGRHPSEWVSWQIEGTLAGYRAPAAAMGGSTLQSSGVVPGIGAGAGGAAWPSASWNQGYGAGSSIGGGGAAYPAPQGYYGAGSGYYGSGAQSPGPYGAGSMPIAQDPDSEETVEFQPHMLPGYGVMGAATENNGSYPASANYSMQNSSAPFQHFDSDLDSEQTVEFQGDIHGLYGQKGAPFISTQQPNVAHGQMVQVESEDTMEYDQHVAALAREVHAQPWDGDSASKDLERFDPRQLMDNDRQAGMAMAAPVRSLEETMELSEFELAQLALDEGGNRAVQTVGASGSSDYGFARPVETAASSVMAASTPGALAVTGSRGEAEYETGIFAPVNEAETGAFCGLDRGAGNSASGGLQVDDAVLMRASAEDGEETLALKRELVKRITQKHGGVLSADSDLADGLSGAAGDSLPASVKGTRGGFVAFLSRNRTSLLLGLLVVALLIGWLAFIIPYRASHDKDGAAARAVASFSIVNIVTTPAGATVEVDDKKVEGVTPLELKGLEPGEIHKLKVSLAGYKIREESVTVNKDERKELTLNLDKLTGELVVVTTPAGAEVLMDGKVVGKAPVTLSALPLESNPVIKAKLDGYKESEKTAVWAGREQVQLDFALEKEPVKTVAKAAPARSTSTASADRRSSSSSTRTAATTSSTRRDATSSRTSGRTSGSGGGAQVSSGMGLISVHAIPWASVFIDNRKFADETPIIKKEIKAGRRSVKVFYPSLNKFSAVQTVIIKEGEEQRLIFKE